MMPGIDWGHLTGTVTPLLPRAEGQEKSKCHRPSSSVTNEAARKLPLEKPKCPKVHWSHIWRIDKDVSKWDSLQSRFTLQIMEKR